MPSSLQCLISLGESGQSNKGKLKVHTSQQRELTIKERNDMDLTEQKILTTDGKNTQKNYTKKIFMTHIAAVV